VRITRLVPRLAMALFVLGGCGNSNDNPTVADRSPPSAALRLDAADFAFHPLDLLARAGQDVTVVFRNTGAAEHNFSVATLKVSQDAQKGQTKTVRFKAPAVPAELRFFCRYHEKSYDMYGMFHFS
jgi:plastocyanin